MLRLIAPDEAETENDRTGKAEQPCRNPADVHGISFTLLCRPRQTPLSHPRKGGDAAGPVVSPWKKLMAALAQNLSLRMNAPLFQVALLC